MARAKKPLTFPYAIKSFCGFLEGRSKSDHTIKGYRSDLGTFGRFLSHRLKKKPADIKLQSLNLADMEQYAQWLKKEGYKANSRRRKLLTVRRLYRYLHHRGKLQTNVTDFLPAPEKVERIPETMDVVRMIEQVKELPVADPVLARNRVMVWILAETGCRVNELTALRFVHFKSNQIIFENTKGEFRKVKVSPELFKAVKVIEKDAKSPYLFSGFNKFGPLSSRISDRGVEMVLDRLAMVFEVERMSPRLVRHSVIAHWLKSGVSESEVRGRLGLKSDYAFRVYRPMLAESV